ncbi:amidohydrolase [Clostridium aestuarii]|uniref:Amidohydrolase n=1 Tax=Clostridium aestuarii TaxID=338193 RepID=A0ABT4CVX8_9CLOT|nr:amidohydrolase [Clostridium aestuarii]MCY6483135.1 amidohydrolase [Clostridium aestuarii]
MYTNKIKELSEKYYDRVVKLRHQFHMHPETAFEEIETAKTIENELNKLEIQVTSNVGQTGVVGLIRGKYPGKTVLLRADMDALNINEEVDIPYKSKIPGKMHACGHDGHTAGLLGTAMILNDIKHSLHGNIKLVFQPAEEDDGGAKLMIDEGVLENPHVDAAFGCHLWGGVHKGKIEVKHGPLMASPDKFIFKVIGRGGHGAMPHISVDPISIAVQAINSMQTIVSRRINPLEPAVVTFGSIHGGENHNVIPNEVEVTGTIRTFNQKLRKWIPEVMESILKGITEMQGASYEYKYIEHFPALINDNETTDFAAESLSKIVGKENVSEALQPNMGGEDFAFFAQEVPASFFLVGIAEDRPVMHHNPKFAWSDEVLLITSQALAQVAVDYLNEHK